MSTIYKYEGNTTGTVTINNADGAKYRLVQHKADNSTEVPIARGGTGATTASDARTNLGITAANLGLDGFSTGTYSQVTKSRLLYTSDTNTYIEWNTADQLKLIAGGVEMIHCVEGGTDYVDIIDRVRVTAGGNLECEGDVIAYTTTTVSDRNLKEDIQTIESSLEKINQLNGVTFKWKDRDEKSAGLIAQEVEEVLPEVVNTSIIRDGEEFKSLNYDGVVGLLVEAVKELSTKVKELENR